MKHFAAKIMMTLACCILLMHAVVPHHHHDCCGQEGFVFETEVSCHCSDDVACAEHHLCHHHDGQSHHPLSHCKLQDLLAHLVISHKGDDTSMSLMLAPECELVGLPGELDVFHFDLYATKCELLTPHEQTALPVWECAGSVGLRAPPMC